MFRKIDAFITILLALMCMVKGYTFMLVILCLIEIFSRVKIIVIKGDINDNKPRK